jgi:hypothetical protein
VFDHDEHVEAAQEHGVAGWRCSRCDQGFDPPGSQDGIEDGVFMGKS